jgi:hypothetical protein
MLSRYREGVCRSQPSRLPPCCQVKFRSNAADEFRFPPFCGEHSREEKRLARLDRLEIDAERVRRRGKLDTNFLQPLLGAAGREPS